MGECHVVFLATTAYPDLKVARKCIHYRHADTVQAAGELVVFGGELATGMQPGQDHLDAGHTLIRVHIDRHATTIVSHLQ
jgi:hypothetical protein